MSEYKRRKLEEDLEATTDDEGGAYAEVTTDDEGGAEATTDDEGGAEVASDDSFKYLFSDDEDENSPEEKSEDGKPTDDEDAPFIIVPHRIVGNARFTLNTFVEENRQATIITDVRGGNAGEVSPYTMTKNSKAYILETDWKAIFNRMVQNPDGRISAVYQLIAGKLAVTCTGTEYGTLIFKFDVRHA